MKKKKEYELELYELEEEYFNSHWKGLSTHKDQYDIYNHQRDSLRIINPSPPKLKKKRGRRKRTL